MQSPSLDACKSFKLQQHFQFLGCSSYHYTSPSMRKPNYCYPCVSCSFKRDNEHRTGRRDSGSRKFDSRERVKVKGKENVWSIDNEMAKMDKERDNPKRRRKRGGKRMRSVSRKSNGDIVMISSAMLMEVETVLQTQEDRQAGNHVMTCQADSNDCH